MTLTELRARANTKLQSYAQGIQDRSTQKGISQVEEILYTNFEKEELVSLLASIQPVPNLNPVRYRIQFHVHSNNFFLDYGGLVASTSLWTLTTDFPNYHNPILSNLDPKDPYFESNVVLAIAAVYDPA